MFHKPDASAPERWRGGLPEPAPPSPPAETPPHGRWRAVGTLPLPVHSMHHINTRHVFIPTKSSWGEALLRFVHRAAWDRLSEESCPRPTAPPTPPAGWPSVRRTVPPAPHWGRCSAPSPCDHKQRLNSRRSAYRHCRAETSVLHIWSFLIFLINHYCWFCKYLTNENIKKSLWLNLITPLVETHNSIMNEGRTVWNIFACLQCNDK